ncbi:hypothetical protein CEXT_33381 [Caerostris extrusa]|uniref:Uncharacterized protein n=1 Tax=Caerostris extrusa TaxID=172846 RepID=A0AAV4T220_CAEEX|nr:hypothetical protein CEXT_33381 [Caerostris extrusa]
MFMKWRVRSVPAFPWAAVRSLVCGRGGHFTRGNHPMDLRCPAGHSRDSRVAAESLGTKVGNGGRQGRGSKGFSAKHCNPAPKQESESKERMLQGVGEGGVGEGGSKSREDRETSWEIKGALFPSPSTQKGGNQ